MNEFFVTAGLACLIAAIVGGGLKAFGIEIPVLKSTTRQVALGALGLILIILGRPSPHGPETVIVPNVVGLPTEEAQTTLRKSDLEPGSLKSEEHKTASAGTILRQVPQAGVQVSKGKTVDLVVAVVAEEPPLPPAGDNWSSQNYDAALVDFADIVQESADPAARELAQRRLDWLARYRGHIIFADDLQNDTIGSGARWELHEPGPGGGTGKFARVQENGNFVLEGRGHYHAAAQIQNSVVTQNFEIQLRFRPRSPQAGRAHINIMMDPDQGRTTIGIYITERRISAWETMRGQQDRPQTRIDRSKTFDSRWYKLRAVIIQGKPIQIFLDDQSVINYTSLRPQVFLQEFNLEILDGIMQFDDVLVVSLR